MIKQFTENYYSEMIEKIQTLEPVVENKTNTTSQVFSNQAISEEELKQIENKL